MARPMKTAAMHAKKAEARSAPTFRDSSSIGDVEATPLMAPFSVPSIPSRDHNPLETKQSRRDRECCVLSFDHRGKKRFALAIFPDFIEGHAGCAESLDLQSRVFQHLSRGV